jgi:release factor glutamine methyltransferase
MMRGPMGTDRGSTTATTVGELLDRAEERLEASDAVEHPHRGKERADAEEILAFVLALDPEELEPGERVDARRAARFHALVARREAGEPPAYITGRTYFCGLRLEVRPGAFIPRQSSEFTVEQAARRLRSRRSPVHVDLATGVGPLALAVAARVRQARVFGVDLAARPLALARRNAEALGLANATFLRGDLFAPLPAELKGALDVVTLHPPYVGLQELEELPDEIRRFEPEESLTDYSPQGMGLIGRTAVESRAWLRPGGWLLIEVSPDRSRAVATVLRRAGFGDVRSTKGGIGVTRVLTGRR